MENRTKVKQVPPNRPKKRKKKHPALRIFVLILIILGIVGGILAKRLSDVDGNWLALIMGHNKETLKNLDKLDILIMGESGGMSDTIMICSYDPKTQNASLLSIPRDTFIGDSKKRASVNDKINAVYNNGGRDPKKTIEAVNKITGLNIQYYLLVDTKALVELVDLIGGVEFDVPIDMNYDDSSQDLYIHLKAGYQKLNGKQVEGLTRFRHNNDWTSYPANYGYEDFGRMKTQRNVMTAIAKQTIKLKNVKEIGNILDIAGKYVKTNINIGTLKDYIPYAVNMNTENIRTEQLPGVAEYVNGISFFLYNEEKAEDLINEMFKGITNEDINEANTN